MVCWCCPCGREQREARNPKSLFPTNGSNAHALPHEQQEYLIPLRLSHPTAGLFRAHSDRPCPLHIEKPSCQPLSQSYVQLAASFRIHIRCFDTLVYSNVTAI